MIEASRRSLPRHTPALTPEGLLHLVREVTSEGGELWVGTQGPSMSPTIREGDRVLLTPPGNARPGDVLLADVNGRAILHRLVRVDGELLQLAGDGVVVRDAPVPRDRIVARAVAREREGEITALAWDARVGVMPLVRGLFWRLRLGVAQRARELRGHARVGLAR